MMLNYVYSDLPNKSPPLDSFGQGGGCYCYEGGPI